MARTCSNILLVVFIVPSVVLVIFGLTCLLLPNTQTDVLDRVLENDRAFLIYRAGGKMHTCSLQQAYVNETTLCYSSFWKERCAIECMANARRGLGLFIAGLCWLGTLHCILCCLCFSQSRSASDRVTPTHTVEAPDVLDPAAMPVKEIRLQVAEVSGVKNIALGYSNGNVVVVNNPE